MAGDLARMTSAAATPEVEVLAPAVPTMWSGALGLAAKYWLEDLPASASLSDYLKAMPEETEKIPLDFYPWTRFPTVLLTSLMGPVFYLLLSKLIKPGPALLAALLLALDPFFLGLSRVIHHDALVSIFIVTSLLTLLIYRSQHQATFNLQPARLWLILSGVSGGLALLTKPTALYLVIFVFLFLLLEQGLPRTRPERRRALIESCLWMMTALITFGALWPALWRAPLATFSAWFNRSATAAGDNNNYALIPGPGDPLPELGFLFYPVNWLFKATLPMFIGLVALPVGWRRGWLNRRQRWSVKWLSIFSLLFLILLIPAQTRDIRYFLPGMLILYSLAAVGILALAARLKALFPTAPPTGYVVQPHLWFSGLLLGIQLSLTIIYAPYFVDYWNPVVGGPWLAPHLVKIGSGEGLDQVGRYLNQKPNAQNLTAATSFWESFVPFFAGRYTKSHYTDEADYILIYRRQIQNNNPFPEYWTYFSARTPEYKVSLVGLDYAWLYPGPQLRVVRDADFGAGLVLRGYRLDRAAAQPGQVARLTLIWAGATPAQANLPVRVQLLDAAGQPRVETGGPLLAPEGPSPVEGHYLLEIPEPMQRGDYPLLVSIVNQVGAESTYQIGSIPVRYLDKPPAQFPVSLNFGDWVIFGGANVSYTPAKNGETTGVVDLTFLWQARQAIPRSYTTFAHVVDEAGHIWGQADRIPGDGAWPAQVWETREWIVDTFQISLNPDTPAGTYTLLAGLYDSETFERLPIIEGENQQTVVEITSIIVP